jgi:hypothetical protein
MLVLTKPYQGFDTAGRGLSANLIDRSCLGFGPTKTSTLFWPGGMLMHAHNRAVDHLNLSVVDL